MFSRIRRAAQVLSSSKPKPDCYTQPDIVFEEEEKFEVSKTSLAISNLISFIAIALAVGASAAFFVKKIPMVPSQHVTFTVGVFAFILAQLWNQIVKGIESHIHSTLRVGERMAPYVGHKITRALRILRS